MRINRNGLQSGKVPKGLVNKYYRHKSIEVHIDRYYLGFSVGWKEAVTETPKIEKMCYWGASTLLSPPKYHFSCKYINIPLNWCEENRHFYLPCKWGRLSAKWSKIKIRSSIGLGWYTYVRRVGHLSEEEWKIHSKFISITEMAGPIRSSSNRGRKILHEIWMRKTWISFFSHMVPSNFYVSIGDERVMMWKVKDAT